MQLHCLVHTYTKCPRRKCQYSGRSWYRSFQAKKRVCTFVLFRKVSRHSYFNEQEFGFGTQYCPSLPPYFAPSDFCLWGWMKGKVYRTKVDTQDELLDLIMDVITSIKERQDALRQATRHVLTRVAKCTDVHSGIFKNVLY